MKNRKWLGAAAAFVALALVIAGAYAQTIHDEGGEGTGGGGSGSYDSTTRTLLNGGADTTSWINLNDLNWARCCLLGTTWVRVIISGTIGAGDTLGVRFDWAPHIQDITRPRRSTVTLYTGGAPMQVPIFTCKDSTGIWEPYGYVRVITTDEDVTRTFSYPNFRTVFLLNTAR